MIDGITLKLGEEERVVPPLSLRALRRLAPKLKSIQNLGAALPNDEQIDVVVEVVLAALNRNYPEMTKEQVEDALDTGNMTSVLMAIFTSSGLQRGAVTGEG